MPSPADTLLPWTFCAVCLLTMTCIARASLWESSNWTLLGDLNGSVGYDSNLTLSRDGPGDSFVLVTPDLTFSRQNSSTDFHVDGSATYTNFINNRQPDQTDLSFAAVYAYPKADNVIPVYRVDTSWIKSSDPYSYLGRRVKSEQLSVGAEGYLPLTGKLGIRGTADFNSTDLDDVSVNNSDRAAAFAGIAYQRDPQTEISLNLGAALGDSTPNSPQNVNSDIHSRELYITAKIRGEITPKITGSAYAGYGTVNYTGGYTNRESLPVTGADLTWAIDPLRSLTLSAFSGATYAPDGSIADTIRAKLTFGYEIVDQWQYSLYGGRNHSVYSREVRQRTDESWEIGMGFAYQPSRRFQLSLSVDHTDQDSDTDLTAQFKHDVVSLSCLYRF
jgi:Putative beta-barrel porin 2